MKIDPDSYRIREGEDVDLAKRPTRIPPPFVAKIDYASALQAQIEELRALQKVLYASDSHAFLIILQGMDTAGKDSMISHVMSGVDPQGCDVTSFKQPSSQELAHDFLWRGHCAAPLRGRIGIFNRSYYEEVLVVRVHPELLAPEGLNPKDANKKLWKDRYRSIVDMERHLSSNLTQIVKIFLHLSREEQRKRLLARIDEPDKNWKFHAEDIAERARWDDYVKAYERALSATSTDQGPWYVVPADEKPTSRLIVAAIVVDALKRLGLRYPELSDDRRKELEVIRRELEREGQATQSPTKKRAGKG